MQSCSWTVIHLAVVIRTGVTSEVLAAERGQSIQHRNSKALSLGEVDRQCATQQTYTDCLSTPYNIIEKGMAGAEVLGEDQVAV